MAELVADSTVRKSAVTSGLLLGVISSVLGILSFYFTTTMTTSMWLIIFSPLIFSIILPIVIAVFFMIDLRKKIGGFWSFKQATTGAFIMFIISSLVSFILVTLLFAKVIEPNMIDKSQEATVNAVTAMMEKTNAPQENIDKAITDVNKQFDDQKQGGVGKAIMGLGIMVIVSFILALIFGAIFKKEPPRYIVEDTDPAV